MPRNTQSLPLPLAEVVVVELEEEEEEGQVEVEVEEGVEEEEVEAAIIDIVSHMQGMFNVSHIHLKSIASFMECNSPTTTTTDQDRHSERYHRCIRDMTLLEPLKKESIERCLV